MFQVFFVTASKPHFGLYVTLAAGFANMILDGVFLGVLGMGVDGAALATVISQTIGGVLPLVYFALPGRKALRIGKTRLNLRWLFDTVSNGLSEFLSSISSSVVGMLYNFQLLKYAGAAGVAAYGVIMYGNFIFTGVYFGYSMGIAPAVSYHYGAENTKELKGLFAKSLHIIAAFMVVLTALAEVFAPQIVSIFVGYDGELCAFLHFHGIQCLRIRFLHGIEQREDISTDFLRKDTRFRGDFYPSSSGGFRNQRDLVSGYSCRECGIRSHDRMSDAVQKGVPVRLICRTRGAGGFAQFKRSNVGVIIDLFEGSETFGRKS